MSTMRIWNIVGIPLIILLIVEIVRMKDGILRMSEPAH
jgi:hypothetical protein